MIYITPLKQIPDGDYYVDGFNRVFDKDKKPIICPTCKNQIEYATTIGFHCTDNLLHTCLTKHKN